MDSNSEIQGYKVYPMLHFHRKFSSSIVLVQEHVPWAWKTLPIPLGICEKVIELIRRKVDSGVYKTSYSSYHH